MKFDQALSLISQKHPAATLVEIGAHPVLHGYLLARYPPTQVTGTLRRPRVPESGVETRALLNALGRIVAAGHNCVDFDVLYAPPTRADRSRTRPLAYPFAPKPVTWAAHTMEITRQTQPRNGPMNYPQLSINVRTHPGLADHVIKGEPIMPAAGFLEMVSNLLLSELFINTDIIPNRP